MTEAKVRPGSLVLYKGRPAVVRAVGDKLEIEAAENAETWTHAGVEKVKVRPKDIDLLHPGPVESFAELAAPEGEVLLAWELLSEMSASGQSHSLGALAELAYGDYTPASAWAAWLLVADGLYFQGSSEAIQARSHAEVLDEQAARAARVAEAAAWQQFLEKARGQAAPEAWSDAEKGYLRDLEELVLGRRGDSPLLRALGRAEQPENAHALLLELGYWNAGDDPYPARFGLPVHPPQIDLPDLPDEERLDLTHLTALAIDDAGNQDPDDAISLENGRIWVHVADVAALAPPDSPVDQEARGRGASLYLPEGTVPMLPPETVQRLGLGLHEISPALSFGIELSDRGEIRAVEVHTSWVRVERISYAEAETRLSTAPLRELHTLTNRYCDRRWRNGAVFIDLPEVKMQVVDGMVEITPIERLQSRDLVREAMLMAGEAASRFALEHDIPFLFAVQEPVDPAELPEDLWPANLPGAEPAPAEAPPQLQDSLATMFALRRYLRRSQVSGRPGPHGGVGLPYYARATSPLRRYLDLVAHQQLRAFLGGRPLLSESEIYERVGASEAVSGSVNRAESKARLHWTLVYLMQRPDWRGEAVLVERQNSRGKILIPSLALEARIHLRRDLALDSRFQVAAHSIDLPNLEAFFQVTDENPN